MSKLMYCLSVLWFLLFSTRTAHAYLDPGSGSMLLQLLLGGVAGLAVVVKLYWHRFLALFGVTRGEKDDKDKP